MIEIRDKKDCCGCQSCVQTCPKQCISFLMDKEGFFYPRVNIKECIDCHLCEKVCPVNSERECRTPNKVIGAYNYNADERNRSSSGGIFILLAKQIIDEDGVVFGAVFDESWNVKHTYTETIDGIYPMLQSKYVQSSIGVSYINVKRFLKRGRKVLFCGTPCQVLGLKKFLRKDYDNLITVDFLCHGVPSPGVWSKYIEREIFNLSPNSISDVSDIEFRNKSFYGWKKYGFVVHQKSLSKDNHNMVLLSDNHYVNPYMKGFLSDVFLRPSCYDCKCKNGRSGSDLTLGDFWCADRVDEKIDDDKGLSLVLINNPDKMRIDIKEYFQKEFQYDSVRSLNGGFVEKHSCNRVRRHAFYQLYKYLGISDSLKYSLSIGKIADKFLKIWK